MSKECKYSDKELKDILLSYARSHKEKITYTLLEKETGIGRQTWSRRMSKEIKILNSQSYILNSFTNDNIIFPDIIDTIDKFYYNKELLTKKLLWYNDTLKSLYIKLNDLKKIEKKLTITKEELDKEKKKNNDLMRELDFYKNEYLKVSYDKSIEKSLDKLKITDIKEYKQECKEIHHSPLSEYCSSLFDE